MKTNGIFITGTDTGVGKTFVASLIVMALKEKGVDVGVMKPVETGCPEKHGILKPHDALLLKKAGGVKDSLDLINPYRFKEPCAPSAAARKNSTQIKLSKIEKCYKRLSSRHDFMVVEGAGGLLVPLNNKETILDLIKLLNLPVIIVATSRLGAINHTLLTAWCLKRSGVEIKGIILNNPLPDKKRGLKNMEEIMRLTGVRVVEMPLCRNLKELKLPKQTISRILFP